MITEIKAAAELTSIIKEYKPRFYSMAEAVWNEKPGPEKWSKKEILGHLIDSALNNLRRFIVTQYKQNDVIYYLQNDWVKMQNYQGADISDLIELWFLLNKQISRVVGIIPVEKLENTCHVGKDEPEIHTLEFLVDDYVVHMRHHLEQIAG